jgi:outer membrane protein W
VTYHTLGSTYSEKFDDDFTYGVNLGIDVPFGVEHNYAFTAGLRQLFLKAKGSGTLGHNFDVNPTIATAGFAFRFR